MLVKVTHRILWCTPCHALWLRLCMPVCGVRRFRELSRRRPAAAVWDESVRLRHTLASAARHCAVPGASAARVRFLGTPHCAACSCCCGGGQTDGAGVGPAHTVPAEANATTCSHAAVPRGWRRRPCAARRHVALVAQCPASPTRRRDGMRRSGHTGRACGCARPSRPTSTRHSCGSLARAQRSRVLGYLPSPRL